ncbi:hypothetical protein [Gemmata palustris]|uniref:hypothetical protein n=1 Tax=Gemmata palustris TaxID=2822762 RepID=UPI001FE58943|nr:hypothetical protein [Gemmata palustris]
MEIRERRNPTTGKIDLIIVVEFPATPIEHEQMHRTLVEKLIDKGVKPEDMGEIIIERESA